MRAIACIFVLLMGCATVPQESSQERPEGSDYFQVRGHQAWEVEGLEGRPEPKVILLTVDGLRWQEIFRGIDPLILNAAREHSGIKSPEVLKEKYW